MPEGQGARPPLCPTRGLSAPGQPEKQSAWENRVRFSLGQGGKDYQTALRGGWVKERRAKERGRVRNGDAR